LSINFYLFFIFIFMSQFYILLKFIEILTFLAITTFLYETHKMECTTENMFPIYIQCFI